MPLAEKSRSAHKSDPARERMKDRPLRVLHIINDLGLGGAETLLYRLAVRDSQNEHVIVSLGDSGWYSSRLEERGVRLHHLGLRSPWSFPAGVLRLNRILRKSDADVVQCWMYRSNVIGGVIAKAAGKPVVWGIHCSSLVPLKPSSRALARLSGKLARWTPDFVINCSIRSAELHETIGYSAARSAIVHNGYDVASFSPDEHARAVTRDLLGVDANEFAIGSITRWDRTKDIPNLISAMARVQRRGIPFRCILIGAGLDSSNPELARLIEASGCTRVVVPLGSRDDIEKISRAFDLHVLASRTEAFPNVVAETMLSGTPNVVTDVGDAGLMVGNSGWIVRPRNSEQLAEAIIDAHREWREEPESWSARGVRAREQIAKNFSLDLMLDAYKEIWARVADKSRHSLVIGE